MAVTAQVIAAGNGLAQGDRAAPDCAAEPGRRAERISGEVVKGSTFSELTPGGWILRLVPTAEGWFLRVAIKGRETEDLSQLTPPFHFVPNVLEIKGWHFRNAADTGPNDGSVNAPQELREFIFSPDVGRRLESDDRAINAEDVAKVRSFGRAWLFIEGFVLTPPRQGERAGFESVTFSACLTSPVG
jgi:hypothetical protein